MSFKILEFYKINKSLKAKLILFFILASIIPLLYLSITFVKKSTDNLTNSIINQVLRVSNNLSISIKQRLDREIKNINSLKSELLNTKNKNSILKKYDNENSFFETIFILNNESKIINFSDDLFNKYKSFIKYDTILQEIKNEPFLIKPIKIENNIILFYIEKLENKLLIIEFNLDIFSKIISSNLIGKTTSIYILSNNKKIIQFPKQKKEYYDSFINNINNYNYGVYKISANSSKNDFITVYTPIVGFSWKLIICQKVSELYFIVDEFKKHLYVILLLTLLFSFIIAYILSKSVAVPILKVAKAANEIANGNLDVKIDIDSKDEVKQLADSFNRMTDTLKEKMVTLDRKIYEITTVFNISSMINDVTIDMDKLLDIIIDKLIEAADSTRGSIMLLNNKTDTLELARVRIWDSEQEKVVPLHNFKKNIEIKVNEGIAGKVMYTGDTYIMNDPDNDENFKQYKDKSRRINQLICLPLKVNNKTFGVINIANKKDNTDFDIKDISLLETLANQVSICLENVKLFKLSITDGLTELFIVRHFKLKFEEELSRARRYKQNLSLLFFDIDHFKHFNDTYGHQQGDLVLKEVANTMRAVFRDVDILARYGGEEFCILLPETDLDGAYKAAERLRTAIEQKDIQGDKQILKVTISIGISGFPKHNGDILELIRKADTALYFAKENGRNNTQIYNDTMGDKSEK